MNSNRLALHICFVYLITTSCLPLIAFEKKPLMVRFTQYILLKSIKNPVKTLLTIFVARLIYKLSLDPLDEINKKDTHRRKLIEQIRVAEKNHQPETVTKLKEEFKQTYKNK